MSLDTLKRLPTNAESSQNHFLEENHQQMTTEIHRFQNDTKRTDWIRHNRHIDIRDVEDSISRDVVKKELKQLDEDTGISDEFKEIVRCVRIFKPLSSYRNEYRIRLS